MKQVLVIQKEYKTVESELPFNIPTETVYYFIYGIRIAIKIIPRWYDLKDNEQAASLSIIVVHGWPDFIVKKYDVNSYGIGQILKSKNTELQYILETMNKPEERNIRTADQFKTDLDAAINEFQKIEP